MKIILGLGNPGKEYEHTRHNAGFLCAEEFRKKCGFEPFKAAKKFKAAISEGTVNNEKMICALPQTFMNLSGESAAALMNFYRCPLADFWTLYDDIDLALGTIRIRPSGSPGTHNGMKSVTEMLGSVNFPRLRIGIESRGEHAAAQQEISSFVLEPFKKSELPIIKNAIAQGADALYYALTKGIEKAMEKYN